MTVNHYAMPGQLFVGMLTASGKIVEVQGTAEHHPFEDAEFTALMALAKKGVADLVTMQNAALAKLSG